MENHRTMIRILVALTMTWMSSLGGPTVDAFSPTIQPLRWTRIADDDSSASWRRMQQQSHSQMSASSAKENGGEMDPVQAAVNAMYGGGASLEGPDQTRARIQELVQQHPVLLFMKGSKLFPQCGFSDTATKILDALQTDFHAVDVLSDPAIRQGIKDFSQWPTIPQLYINGEFIGGSDIMLEMYQNGELAKLLKKNES
mmetsp:Transcript_114926/g.330012  ORF Transcript_114926/g.330012 Transcript_114926/m.330012 type:complete len:199 (-) Transcript_114926:14-610(-)